MKRMKSTLEERRGEEREIREDRTVICSARSGMELDVNENRSLCFIQCIYIYIYIYECRNEHVVKPEYEKTWLEKQGGTGLVLQRG